MLENPGGEYKYFANGKEGNFILMMMMVMMLVKDHHLNGSIFDKKTRVFLRIPQSFMSISMLQEVLAALQKILTDTHKATDNWTRRMALGHKAI